MTAIAITGTASSNYTANATTSTTANITARSLTITATGVNKVYDGTTAATVSLSDNRASGDVFTDAYTSAAFADKNVGSAKTVTVNGVSISGADAANYSAKTPGSASADITSKAASVTPNATSKTYGAADPPLTGALNGFLAGDAVTANYSRVAGETVAGGPYTISATLTPAAVLGNYTITNNTASFTITKATASVTLSNLTQTFTGSALSPTARTTPAGLAIIWTGAPQTAAGSYPVTATVNDANYQGSASGTFVITGTAPTVTSTLAVSALTPQYSDQETFTVTVTSSIPGQPATGVNFFVGSQQVGNPAPVTVPLVAGCSSRQPRVR